MGGGPKIPYPKHVWSPAGGWYSQPKNWKANTAIAFVGALGIALLFGRISAEKEYRDKMPPPGVFFPSRWISKQIREHERKESAKSSSGSN